jgi:uncharacterized protein
MNEYLLLLFITGALFGYIGGYAGIGGAPFLISFSTIVLGLSQYEAQGTILAVMLGPMSLFSVIVMWDRVKILKWYIFSGVLSYAVFSYFGALGAYTVSEFSLKMLFGFLLLSIGIVNLYVSRNMTKIDQPLHPDTITVSDAAVPVNIYSITILGIITGLFGGFFGIGAGVLMMPVFISVFGMHKDDARALSLAILLPPVSIGAAVKYHSAGAINVKIALIIFFAYFITNYFGAKQGKRHSSRKFRKYFGIILIFLGLSYFIFI